VAAAKPAIAADPAPAAPRNGSAAPAGQPAQQATAVAAAPTQVQAQRPAPAANGATATATANGKQGANGKQDEEDWWTE
jgi:hypothetical protein